MVTYTKTMVKDRLALFSYTGLSTDTKPDQTEGDIFIGNGSTFYEIDTGDVYMYDGEGNNWVQQ